METVLLFALVIGLLFLGVPVGVSLGLSSIVVIAFFSNDSMSSVAQELFTASQNYTLLAIPFFVLASSFMSTGGVAKRIIRFSIATVGHFRGGLAMASVLACMMFAALSGSSPATVVAIGTIAIAGMRQVGYSKEFAAGVIANAGTLGILIPPSIVMVVYAAATNVSVGRMFLAGVVPGIVAGLMLMIAIYAIARRRDLPAEDWKGFGELMNGGKEAGWGLFLIVIIIGGIYGGVFTPTEAAAVAAVYAFVIAIFVYRDMGPMKGRRWLSETEARGTPAHVGFSATVYALAFFFVWMVLSFFVTADWENVTAAGRAWTGLALSLAVLVAYAVWRDPASNPANLPRFVAAGLPVWGRNLGLIGRHFVGAFFHADTRKVMVDSSRTIIMLMFIIVNALLFAHVLTAERIPAGDHRADGRCRLHLVHLPDRGQPAAASRRPVHGAVRPAADRRAGRLPDRHGTRRRSDPSRHHHGGQHGDRHDHPADRAQPLRHLRHHRHEPDPGRARGRAFRRRPARLPGARHLCADAVDGAALCAYGPGNRDPLSLFRPARRRCAGHLPQGQLPERQSNREAFESSGDFCSALCATVSKRTHQRQI